jgi:hypothetical protein
MNKTQFLKHSMAFNILNRYLFRFTLQTRCEQSSQCQRSLVRLLSLSVLGYLNYTLASNQILSGSATAQGSVAPEGATNLFPSTDIDGTGLLETATTTQFVADKNVVSAAKLLPTDFDKIVYDSSSDLLDQDVKQFLGKPTIIKSGSFSSTDTFSTFSSMNLPLFMFQNSSMYSDKVKGYLGFRASVVLKLVVNANRFQQGRYNISYVAAGGADSVSPKTTKWAFDHVATLVQRTTLPHVELDLCCDTEATIKIPYNNAFNFFPFTSLATVPSVGTFGTAFLYPYVPLSAATGNLTCSFTLYAWFEDVQLVSAALPQSGRLVFSKKSRKTETEVEQDSMNAGPISSALIKVRDASTLLAKVPLLSSYATGAAWLSDILASSAKVFGWSKPVVLSAPLRIIQTLAPYSANTDGPDMSYPLSLAYNNSVGVANGFSGTDVDEMSFSFLNTIPVWIFTINWTTAQASNTNLLNLHNCPQFNVHTTTVNTATVSHFAPYQYLATMFKFWRGSMVYKLKFVKTEFHSGRLLVSYSPNNFLDGSTAGDIPDLTSSAFIHRQIIDVREANEFTFVIPYISDSPYRETYSSNEGSTGFFSLLVLDPLIAPATVSQSISIIVERCTGPDFEFGVPESQAYTYFSGITPQSGALEPFSECSNLNTTIGTSACTDDQALNALHCIGERISSVRALLKMPNRLNTLADPTVSGYLNVTPFGIPTGTIVTTVNTPPPVNADIYASFASCYVYSRGGVRIKFLDDVTVTQSAPLSIILDTRDGSTTSRQQLVHYAALDPAGTALTSVMNNMPVMYYRASFTGEVQVPQYFRFHSRVNSDCVMNVANLYANGGAGLAPAVFVTRRAIPLTNSKATVLRSISDDGNFGGFLSIPPMIFVTSTF